MLVALQYKDSPRKYYIENVNISYQPEILEIGRMKPYTVNPEAMNEVAPIQAGTKETFRCTYTALLYKGRNVPIYEQII